MKTYKWMSLIAVLVVVPVLVFAGPSGKLTIFHAGSLTVPFAAIEKAFEARYPQVDVLREAGDSTKLGRLISEVGKQADIMASAYLRGPAFRWAGHQWCVGGTTQPCHCLPGFCPFPPFGCHPEYYLRHRLPRYLPV